MLPARGVPIWCFYRAVFGSETAIRVDLEEEFRTELEHLSCTGPEVPERPGVLEIAMAWVIRETATSHVDQHVRIDNPRRTCTYWTSTAHSIRTVRAGATCSSAPWAAPGRRLVGRHSYGWSAPAVPASVEEAWEAYRFEQVTKAREGFSAKKLDKHCARHVTKL